MEQDQEKRVSTVRQFSELDPVEKVSAILAAQGALTERRNLLSNEPDHRAINRKTALELAGVEISLLTDDDKKSLEEVFAESACSRVDGQAPGDSLYLDLRGEEQLRELGTDMRTVSEHVVEQRRSALEKQFGISF